MRQISFLLVCDTYPPVVGGSEMEAQRVCGGMIRRGHRPQVLCAGGPPMPRVRNWVDPVGVPVRILTENSRGRWRNLIFACEVAWALWSERRNYDIAYFLMQGLHLAFGLPVARLLGKPIVMKVGGSGVIPEMNSSRMGRLELYWLRRWASRIMVLNEGMIQEGLTYGFERSKLYWMPNPTDVNQFRPGNTAERRELRKERGIPESAPVVIYVGRLAKEKGLTWLLEGFAGAVDQVPDAVLLLAGDGAMRDELESLTKRLGLSGQQVRFVGRLPEHEVALLLRSADVFALTSPSEGFSCALAEAMASGLPALVSDIPANSQLVTDGVEGTAVQIGDTAAISEQLVRLMKDEEARKTMGVAARKRITECYSLEHVVELYERLFEEVDFTGGRSK